MQRDDELDHPITAAALGRLLALAGARGVDTDACLRAATWAAQRHRGQRRRSGEPYVTHCLEVASLVVDMGGTGPMTQAALLHDVVEDTDTTVDDVLRAFGPDVARIVDGCTKVAVVHPGTGTAHDQAANLRKLFLSLAADPRVVLVKLCDRLHNLRTIAALPAEKARRIGEETLAIHAPLAHRLGLGALKAELEDRAYAAADPDAHTAMAARIAAADPHQHLQAARRVLEEHLTARGIDATVSGRVKHLWSAHRKSLRMGVDPIDLPDLLGLRLVCAGRDDCYTALGAVHDLWEPDLGRLRDYVNHPKPNGYQSLHTTVTGPDGRRLEIQIRTQAMHEAAEHGGAAHHAYKHGGEPAWVTRLLEWAGEELTDEEYLEGVREELGNRRQILTLTPRGQVVELPDGACPVDFAYAVHSAIGDRCTGARVDGRITSLDTPLRNGQQVEIITGNRNGPAPEWLEWVRTSKARNRIRAHVNRTRADTPATTPAATPAVTPADAAKGMSPERAANRTRKPQPRTEHHEARTPMTPGLGDVSLRIAGCCRPAPGQAAGGVVGHGEVRVHRSDCAAFTRITDTSPGRRVAVHWVREDHTLELVVVTADSRPGLLADLAAAVRSVGGTLLTGTSDKDGRVTVVADTPRQGRRDLRVAIRLVRGVRGIS